MQLLDLTLPTAAENLALDEALLDQAEESTEPREVLRLWQANEPIVVVGRGSQVEREVRVEYCRQQNIPVLRRTSGGAAIVTGPGCLMYALVLSYELRPALRSLDEAHRFVLDTIARTLQASSVQVRREGTSDLACGQLKFSGNSVRCKRRHFLYHGTLLYKFDLELIERCLTMPPRQPAYRENRGHAAFVANLPLDEATLRTALVVAWQAESADSDWPRDCVARLVAERYGQRSWNFQH